MQNKTDNTTFTIDLLKGMGLPIKNNPKALLLIATSLAIPVVVAITMLGLYLSSRITISIQKQAIANYQTKMDKMSDTVELQNLLEEQKNNTGNILSEVNGSISRHTQWSGILATLAKNIPDSVIVTQLRVKEDSVRKKVAKKDEPQKMIDISVPVRTMKISVSGNPQEDCDKAIRDFRNRLRSSDLLGSRLENIRVSQEVDTRSGNDLVCYEIDCIFKPSL